MKTIAVVVTYNRKQLLSECLDALLSQTVPIFKTIVINNASTDGTEELFVNSKYDRADIDVRTMSSNLGGAGGFHEGLKATVDEDCDWVWIMDDDTIPEVNAHEEFINCLKNLDGEKVGFLASSIYGCNGEPMNVPAIDLTATENGYPDWYSNLGDSMIKIRMATFVSILVSHDAILNIGLPYSEFFLWGDDTEYTTRISNYYACGYMCGKSVAIHKRANASRISIITENSKGRIKLYSYFYRNKFINTFEYGDGEAKMRECASVILDIFRVLFRSDVKFRFTKAKTILKGIFQFIIGDYNKKKFRNRITNLME